MKIETPFYVPFMSTDCEFFPEVKDDLIQIIMEKHEEKPFELQGNFPKGKNLKRDLTESDGNFFATENKCISKIYSYN